MNNEKVNSKELVYFDIETAGPTATFEEFKEQDPHGAQIFLNKKERLNQTEYRIT